MEIKFSIEELRPLITAIVREVVGQIGKSDGPVSLRPNGRRSRMRVEPIEIGSVGPLEGADKAWGFPFGADGTLGINEVAETLGVSRSTIERLVSKGKLRKGKVAGKAVICRRSLDHYMATVEL